MNNDSEKQAENAPLVEDDVLGLDQQIKLTKRVRVARLDNQRIFNPVTGLDYILKHQANLVKLLHKSDKKFQKKYNGQSVSRAAKFDHEFDNLSLVLQFYQLWCHGLFPKANFKDCIHLLRRLGAKSSQLRLYRRELIEKELEKLKIAKGIIDDEDDEDDSPINLPINTENNTSTFEGSTSESLRNNNGSVNGTTETFDEDDIDDDWSFMNIPKRGNHLFVGDDDDDDDNLYTTRPAAISRPQLDPVDNETSEIDPPQLDPIGDESTEIEPPALAAVVDETNDESDDPFSDDDEIFHTVIEEPPNEDDILQNDDQELELMREMGMN